MLRIEGDTVLVQVFGDTRGLDLDHSTVIFTDCGQAGAALARACSAGSSTAPSSRSTACRCSCPERWAPVSGLPINPVGPGPARRSSSRPAFPPSTGSTPWSRGRSCRSSPAPACRPRRSPPASCATRAWPAAATSSVGGLRRPRAHPSRVLLLHGRRWRRWQSGFVAFINLAERAGRRAPAGPALRPDRRRVPGLRARAWTCWC